ncbi:MAG TPA: M57 family metalloprotease, partial [Thermoanaerobaculia bacterium]|nr:M57 family metalloprotease [Thermoanaerobaculia bacterium]
MKRLLLLVLIASRLDAATILIAPDDEMIRASRAVVVATAESSRTRWSDTRWIETVTTMRVDEAMKGSLRDGETFDVVELGGIVGETGLMVAGSPRFADGEQVLLLLETNRRGEWTAKNLSAGVFRFRGGFAVRTDVETNEPPRLAEPFLRYVRKQSGTDFRRSGQAEACPTCSITSYLITNPGEGGTLGMRWRSFASTVVFLSHGTQPGALNGGVTSVQRGLSTWTDDPSSNILYAYGGTTARDSGFVGSDGVNSIQFNDPSNEIPGSFTPTGGATLAIGGAWFNTSAASTHVYNGERFYTIVEADLIVQNGITGAGLTGNGFDHVLAHELGHTLGFRHSDEAPSGGTSSSTALMNSSVAFNSDPTGAALQAWDREAVAAVYGSGSTCSPPSITTQPQSVSVAKPEPITLSVAISSATQPTFQWFVGQRGVTNAPIGGSNSSAITVQPQNTTSYWVRVSNGCAPAADSNAAIVTVNGCPAASIDAQSQSTTIVEGTSATL